MFKRAIPALRTVGQIRSASSHAPTPVAKGPSEEVLKLQEKAKGPWGQLSVEERQKLYRASYKQSRKELQGAPSDNMTVLIAVGAAMAIAWVVFRGLVAGAGTQPPTLTKEWQEKTQERIVADNLNPITRSQERKA